jgi:hypothetical protein
MQAFISYSLNEQEQFIATLLSYRLRERGFTLIMSNQYNSVDITTRNQIFVAQLFVGVISSNGFQWKRVLDEYNLAVSNKIPAILLIEDTVPVDPSFTGNYVRFNRNNPHTAVEQIHTKMKIQQPANNDALGWVLGGAALLAIVALLSEGSKK